MADIEGLRTAMHAAVDSEKASADELIRLVRRRHRRHQWHVALAGAAALMALAVAIPAGLGAIGQPPRPEQPPAAPTLYIYSYNGSHEGTVTPVNTATGAPGKPIHVGVPGGPPKDYYGLPPGGQIVITPDGKTAYLTTGSSVTPVNTATGTPGKPIYLGGHPVNYPDFLAITPDGKTVYVTAESGCREEAAGYGRAAFLAHCTITVTPISTATNTPGKTIHVGSGGTTTGNSPMAPGRIVITPDGKTAYVTTRSGVTPISTAANTPGKPIRVRGANMFGENIAITPDGNTVYVTAVSGITPISTATGTPGKPIHGVQLGFVNFQTGSIAITPDGKTAYVITVTGVTPISTATNTSGTPIQIAAVQDETPIGGLRQIVITPDGKTAYVTTGSGVTPISTATNTPGKPIHVVGTNPQGIAIAITP
jgi:glucose/arabinose dehydrogenase